MSNRNEPWRKFVQTFFLAEQPNGYFVLNDIFRFLKEESVEGDELSETGEAAEAAPAAAPEPAPAAAEPVYEPPREPTPPPAPAPEPVAAAPEPPKEAAEPTPAPVAEPPAAAPTVHLPQSNGVPAAEAEKPAAPAVAEKSREPTPAPQQQQQPAAPSPAPPAAPPAASTSAAPPAPAAQPAPAPPAQPAAPPAPKTWASLAASNPKKWGSVAQEARGITETPASPAPSSGTQTPSGQPQNRGPPRHEHPALLAAQSVTTPHCFIKGVTEPITDAALKNTLSRFGPIKEVDIVRTKACAFLEFQSVDSAKRAIIASLNQNQGGEGGVYIETAEGHVRIFVETKKDRGDRPPATGGRGRGGPPVNADGRGSGFRGGRGGPRGGGRGGPAK
ncbi:RAN protein binding protein, variant 3 [Coprinopsis cinerea AmutBmut pab1-1]|nr:RAN protein binding protein, variant 3 [Coprinopsis cinerea AmutBmut pab1-1]